MKMDMPGNPGPPPTILQEAATVTHQRQTVYGRPEEYFSRYAALLSAYLGRNISTHQAVMILLIGKVCRLQETPDHRDSIVDIAGYAACYARVVLSE